MQQPEKFHKIPKLYRQQPEEDPIRCLIAICEVCSDPITIEADDAVFIIENEYIQCDYCKQLNPLTDELKAAAAELLK